MSFSSTLEREFPGALTERQFAEESYRALEPFGFSPDNTIACIGLCRDELCRSLDGLIQEVWGEAFLLSGLGGMFFLGETGMRAAHLHAPIEGEISRVVYFTMPHIGITPDGVIGYSHRIGRPERSPSCGALTQYQQSLATGTASTQLVETDLEQSLLCRRMNRTPVASRQDADLLAITKEARRVLLNDLEHLIKSTWDVALVDYAVFSALQIHGPETDYIQPIVSYAQVSGQRHTLHMLA